MSKLENTYAQALYDLAAEENLTDILREQMVCVGEIFRENPEYLRLLSAPNVPKAERCGLLEESFGGKVHAYVLNFLKILTEKGYIRRFEECCKAFLELYDVHHGILPVQAVTATALTAQQEARLVEKLQKITGKTIRLTCKVDPKCLGGVRLFYDGKQVDGTVEGRLKAVRDVLVRTTL